MLIPKTKQKNKGKTIRKPPRVLPVKKHDVFNIKIRDAPKSDLPCSHIAILKHDDLMFSTNSNVKS